MPDVEDKDEVIIAYAERMMPDKPAVVTMPLGYDYEDQPNMVNVHFCEDPVRVERFSIDPEQLRHWRRIHAAAKGKVVIETRKYGLIEKTIRNKLYNQPYIRPASKKS
jgi:hypothetical protein